MSRFSKTLPANLKVGQASRLPRERVSASRLSATPAEAGETPALLCGLPGSGLQIAVVRGPWNFCLLATVILVSQPVSSWACAACYGASDSPMARGMNWGIFTLLGVVGCVLGTFATFIVFLAKKSAAAEAVQPSPEPTEKI